MISNSETTDVRPDDDVVAIDEPSTEEVQSDAVAPEGEAASTSEEGVTESDPVVANDAAETADATDESDVVVEEIEAADDGDATAETTDDGDAAAEMADDGDAAAETTDDGDAAAETTDTDDTAAEMADTTDAGDAAAETTDAGDVAAETTDDGDDEADEADDITSSDPNMKWYVVHTYSGYENRAKQCLLDRVIAEDAEEMFGKVLIPTEEVVEMKKGAKRTSTRKFFPGYMLVQMNLTTDTWHLVKSTQKITGFVGGTSRMPRPIPDAEVRRITDQINVGIEKPRTKETFEEGSQVRVTDGPFMNFTGSVEEVRPEKQKLRVLVSIFGRATPVELDFIQVERL